MFSVKVLFNVSSIDFFGGTDIPVLEELGDFIAVYFLLYEDINKNANFTKNQC
jgi:hypothetical protein